MTPPMTARARSGTLPFCAAGSSGKSNAPVSYKGSIMYGSKKMRDVEADENGNPVTHGR